MTIPTKKTRLLLLTIYALIASCGGQQYSKPANTHFLESSLQKLRSQQFTTAQHHLHYVEIKDTEEHPVVMIHGTPGSWNTFKFVLGNTQIQSSNHLISIDRLNWGRSISKLNNDNNHAFESQTQAIADIIKTSTKKPVILLGHSLGASLAPKVAIENPELVSGLILVSGTLDPALGSPRWYNKIASLGILKWAVPNELLQSNKEIYALKEGLQTFSSYWDKLTIPVVVIQGTKDELVDPDNVNYLRKQLSHLNKQDNKESKLTIIEVDKAGHFIPWEHTDKIVSAIQTVTEYNKNQTLVNIQK